MSPQHPSDNSVSSGKPFDPCQIRDSQRLIEFDSEVISLIDDLSLVLKMSPEGREWFSRWLASRHHTPLCERYNVYVEMKQRDNARLLRDLARRNAKYSRFSYEPDNFALQGKLDL